MSLKDALIDKEVDLKDLGTDFEKPFIIFDPSRDLTPKDQREVEEGLYSDVDRSLGPNPTGLTLLSALDELLYLKLFTNSLAESRILPPFWGVVKEDIIKNLYAGKASFAAEMTTTLGLLGRDVLGHKDRSRLLERINQTIANLDIQPYVGPQTPYDHLRLLYALQILEKRDHTQIDSIRLFFHWLEEIDEWKKTRSLDYYGLLSLIDNFKIMKFLNPRVMDSDILDQQTWGNLMRGLNQERSSPNTFSQIAIGLGILAAHEVKVTSKGLELTFSNPRPAVSPVIPERRDYP